MKNIVKAGSTCGTRAERREMEEPMNVPQALSIVKALEDPDEAETLDCTDLAMALRVAAEHQYETRPGISMKGVRGAPDWAGYESGIWKLSEQVRAFLRRRREVRGKHALLDGIADIVEARRYGKGRQNLILLLGEYGRGEYGEVLGRLLNDEDVYGHALNALYRARIGGHAERAREIVAGGGPGWIRTTAKKYCEKFG